MWLQVQIQSIELPEGECTEAHIPIHKPPSCPWATTECVSKPTVFRTTMSMPNDIREQHQAPFSNDPLLSRRNWRFLALYSGFKLTGNDFVWGHSFFGLIIYLWDLPSLLDKPMVCSFLLLQKFCYLCHDLSILLLRYVYVIPFLYPSNICLDILVLRCTHTGVWLYLFSELELQLY